MTQPPNWQGNGNANGGWNQQGSGPGYPSQGNQQHYGQQQPESGYPQQYPQQGYGQPGGGQQPYGYPPQEPKKKFPTVAVISVLATLLIVLGGVGVYLVMKDDDPSAEPSTSETSESSSEDPSEAPSEDPGEDPSEDPGDGPAQFPANTCYTLTGTKSAPKLNPAPCGKDPAQGITLYAVSSHKGDVKCTDNTMFFQRSQGSKVVATVCLAAEWVQGHCYAQDSSLSGYKATPCPGGDFKVASITPRANATCPSGQKPLSYGKTWERTYCLAPPK